MDRSRGFTIIELAIAMAIMGILLALAMPSYSDYMRNVKVRAEAEAFVSGLQLARSEAVRRNVRVSFLLTSDAPAEANVATVTAAAAGPNWMARTAEATPVFIEARFAPLSGGAAVVRINDITSPASDDPDAPPATQVQRIDFSSLGRVVETDPASLIGADFKFTIPGLKCQTDGGPVRCLRVTVTPFGQTRVCDPRAAADDPRRC